MCSNDVASLKKFSDSISLNDQNAIENGSVYIWSKIYKKFQAMQKISCAKNVAIGGQVTLFLAESMVLYSLNLNAVFIMINPVRGIDTVYFISLTVATFLTSANICSQVAMKYLNSYF